LYVFLLSWTGGPEMRPNGIVTIETEKNMEDS